MLELYKGEIKHLLIFAAPGGSGKTTFLNAPEERLADDAVPKDLAGFHDMARNHINIMGMRHETTPSFKSLCIHVDLTTPVRRMKPKPKLRERLLVRITPELFSNWTDLRTYTKQAETIDIVTFFVRREEHFQRWAGRALRKNPDGGLRTIVAIINGDSTNGSELHRGVYSAWCEFAHSLNPRSFHVLDGNGEKYQFISSSSFKAEIDNGYKS